MKYEGNAWQAPGEVKKLRGKKTPRPEGGWVYVVPVGEVDLWDVALSVYGNSQKKDLLEKANPDISGIIIPTDTKVICPPATGH